MRAALVAKQRELLDAGDWVAEGRDIGTVVAPDAEVKVLLTADPRERARRRDDQPVAEVVERDERDADARRTRRCARADDAVEVDTTGLSIDEVVASIVALVGAVRAMKVAIVGYPNVGKSSLVNRLTRVARGGRPRAPRHHPRPQGDRRASGTAARSR